jgi:hypothetical protein
MLKTSIPDPGGTDMDPDPPIIKQRIRIRTKMSRIRNQGCGSGTRVADPHSFHPDPDLAPEF